MRATTFKLVQMFVFAVFSLVMPACGVIALEPTPTSTATITPTLTPTFTPTITFTPTRTSTPTATPNITATQQYADFFPIVLKYYDEGILPSLEGQYQFMGDYTDSSIDAGFYRWDLYENEVVNFIVRADIVLNTAPAPASQSGCGFVFDLYPNQSYLHRFIFLQRNGSAVFGTGGRTYTTKYYAQLENPAEFTMLLVVHGQKLRLNINDEEVIAYNDLESDRVKQAWGPALLAGSTQDFGTRCDFTNIEFWEIAGG